MLNALGGDVLGVEYEQPCANQVVSGQYSLIYLENHPISHGRRKHIERRYHLFKDQVGKWRLNIEYYNLQDRVAFGRRLDKNLKSYKI